MCWRWMLCHWVALGEVEVHRRREVVEEEEEVVVLGLMMMEAVFCWRFRWLGLLGELFAGRYRFCSR